MSVIIAKTRTIHNYVWNLEINGVIVGSAAAIYKTPTQRVWQGEIKVNIKDVEEPYISSYVCGKGDNSVRGVIAKFTEELEGKEVTAEKKVEKKLPKTRFPWVLTSSQINEENVLDISEQFQYKVEGRTVSEQVLYVQNIIKKKFSTSKFGDLLVRVDQGEYKGAAYDDLFPDEEDSELNEEV